MAAVSSDEIIRRTEGLQYRLPWDSCYIRCSSTFATFVWTVFLTTRSSRKQRQAQCDCQVIAELIHLYAEFIVLMPLHGCANPTKDTDTTHSLTAAFRCRGFGLYYCLLRRIQVFRCQFRDFWFCMCVAIAGIQVDALLVARPE